MTLVKQSGCKINLLLNILGKRDDGFHELETVMQPVPLFDGLTFRKQGSKVVLRTNHPTLPCDRTNLVVKAAESFLNATQISDGVSVFLEKRVPMEAGMGGGSSNAAITLSGLNELFDFPLSTVELATLAANLGSDVPFFLQNGPALATGRGECIQPLKPFDCLSHLSLLLFHPGFGISTEWSYGSLARFPDGLNGKPGRAIDLVEALQDSDASWRDQLYNSLELPAFDKYPVIQLYIELFKEERAVASLMSGSGSTVYAFFDTNTIAEAALERLKSKFGETGWSTILAP